MTKEQSGGLTNRGEISVDDFRKLIVGKRDVAQARLRALEELTESLSGEQEGPFSFYDEETGKLYCYTPGEPITILSF